MRFKSLLLFVGLLMIKGCQSQPTRNPEFGQLALLEDLDQLERALVKHHAGLYWHQDEKAFRQSLTLAKKRAAQGLDLVAFYEETGKVLSGIGCGHTRQRLDESRWQQYMDTAKVLPGKYTFWKGDIYFKVDVQGIPAGSKLLQLGGFSATEIRNRLYQIYPSDGFNTTGKDRYISRLFEIAFPTFFGLKADMLDVKVELPGPEIQDMKLDLVHFNSRPTPPPLNEILSLKYIDDKTGYLRIKSFGSGYLRSNGLDYYPFLEKSFAELRTKGIEKLVIDIRSNGGGDDNYGSKLISYLTSQPFKYFKSIEVNPDYRGWGSIQEDNGRYWVTSHNSLAMLNPSENNFQGKVVLLVDGGTFSTAADVTAVAQNLGVAQIIGEETGGGVCGNTSGSTTSISLNNTGIQVFIPQWKYLNDLKSIENCGNGVIPEVNLYDIPWTDNDEVLDWVFTNF